MYTEILNLWNGLIVIPDTLPTLQGEKVQYIIQNLGVAMPHILTWLTICSFIFLCIWIIYKLITIFK